MKRVFGYVLVTVGFTLIFLSPFLLFYATPRLEKAPTDTKEQIVSTGQGTYFSAQQLKAVTTPVKVIEVLIGQPQKSTDDVAVVNYTSKLFNPDDGTPISYDKEVYAMNRHTGVAENCCGETPKMRGQTLKFPFGTAQKSYLLWDPTANAALPVSYSRSEDLEGVTAYIFEGKPHPVQNGTLDLPNSLIGVEGQGLTTTTTFYQASTTVWIEPQTGRVLKGEKDLQQWAELNGAKVLDLADIKIAYDAVTVARFVDDAKKDVKQLRIVTKVVPIFGPIIGVILVVIGLMMLRAPRSTSTSSREPQAAAA